MGSALIHRREDLEEAAATVLIFSAVTGAALYAVAFFAAPYASAIFHVHGLTSVLRVLALLLPIRSFSTVPSALLERAVEFRPRTVSDLVAATSSGRYLDHPRGARSGCLGFRRRARLRAAPSSAIAALDACPTRPDPRRASRRIARELLRYGRYITGGNLLMIASTSMDNVVVARLLGATLLGFYSVAFRLTELPVLVIGSIVGRVMFPIYSMMRDDVATVRRAYVQNLQRVALLSLPVSVGMAAGARPLVRVAPRRPLASFGGGAPGARDLCRPPRAAGAGRGALQGHGQAAVQRRHRPDLLPDRAAVALDPRRGQRDTRRRTRRAHRNLASPASSR